MIRNLIEEGLQRHRAGQLSEAKILYEQALSIEPRHPDALHLSGLVALQGGDPEKAIGRIQAAIEVQPENPGFHANLGQALLAARRYVDARLAFGRASALEPREPQFAVGAANCLALQGDSAQAEKELRAASQRFPGYALAWFNLGNAVRDQRRYPEAVELYRRALALDSTIADAHNGLGHALHQLERLEEAEQAYRRCLALRPDHEAGNTNLASVLIDRGRFADAATVCEQALQRGSASAELYLQLGGARTRQGKLTAALDAFSSAAQSAPDNSRAAWAYGYAMVRTGKERVGLPRLEQALALQPDSAEYRSALATTYLSLGKLEAGWRQYEWRAARINFMAEHASLRPVTSLPESLPGAKICVLREQGLGDELFFLRYCAALKSRGAEIVYRAHPRIAPMLARVPTLDRVIAENLSLPSADIYVLAGDLPLALGVSDFTPPLSLTPNPEQLASMKQWLAALGPPPYLGLTWRAGTAPERQRGSEWSLHKAIPLDPLGALLRQAEGTFIALQRHPESGEIGRLAELAGKPLHDLTVLNDDLESMLALLALIDDYVGVSNTNMHLRAATGRAAKVLVPQPPEWRWMATGGESPWFPGFQIYRQDIDGNWGEAFGRLATGLLIGKSTRE